MKPYNMLEMQSLLINAGLCNLGVVAACRAETACRYRFLGRQDNLAVAALVALDIEPHRAAQLVDHGKVWVSSHAAELYCDERQGSQPAIVLAVVETVDGHLWQVLLDDLAHLARGPDDDHAKALYYVSATRGGRLSDEDVATHVSHLITVRPDVLATAHAARLKNVIDHLSTAGDAIAGRYLVHLEHHLQVMSVEFDRPEEAVSALHAMMPRYLTNADQGLGLVCDLVEGTIVHICHATPTGIAIKPILESIDAQAVIARILKHHHSHRDDLPPVFPLVCPLSRITPATPSWLPG